MSTGEVCETCYHSYPLTQQGHGKCLVTDFNGRLVKIRPLPAPSDWPPRFYKRCYDSDKDCRFYPRCRFAHGEAEKRAWNRLLMERRGPHYVPAYTPHIYHPSHVPSAGGAMRSTPRAEVIRRGGETYLERQKEPPPPEDMSLPVAPDTYRRKYKSLLHYEEEEHVDVLKKKCNGVYKLTRISSRQPPVDGKYAVVAYIEGMTPRQITYAFQASGFAVVTVRQQPLMKCEATLLMDRELSDDLLYVGFSAETARKFKTAYKDKIPQNIDNVQVEFEVKHSYFNQLHKSVNIITDKALKRITPSACHFKHIPDINYRNESIYLYPQHELDKDQFRGFKSILFAPVGPPILIPGPFGCGKTRIISKAAEAIIHTYRQWRIPGRVLVCCYQQDSADIFMKEYFVKMKCDVRLVRVTSSLHHCRDPSLAPFHMYVNDFNRRFSDIFKHDKYVIIVTTYGGAVKMSHNVPNTYFTHILVDEGAQTREPETLGPFTLANENTRIAIAGDKEQYGPQLAVLGDELHEFGLGMSLLERLHVAYNELGSVAQNYIVNLRRNYRCHEKLLELPSKLFYNSSLIPRGIARLPHGLHYPFKFICSSFSTSLPESVVSSDECQLLLDEVLKCQPTAANKACITAPSLNQVNLIRKYLYNLERNKFNHLLKYIDVRTSYKVQGQEYSYLFISTVESLEETGRPFDILKSLCHPLVFNTAITRSKSLVVVVGNPLILLLSEVMMDDPKWCWREYINRCMDNDTFHYGPYLEEDYRRFREQLDRMRHSRDTIETVNIFNGVLPKPEPSNSPNVMISNSTKSKPSQPHQSKPVVPHQSKPVVPQTKPVVPHQSKPVVPQAKPVVPHQSKPVVPQAKPVVPQAKPVVPHQSKPVVPQAKPVVPQAKPVVPHQSKPVVPHQSKPVVPQAKPVVPQAKPVVPHQSKPVVPHQSKPVVPHQSKPVVPHQSKPVVPQAKPVVPHQSKPVVPHQSKPVVPHQSKPVVPQAKPVVPQTKPSTTRTQESVRGQPTTSHVSSGSGQSATTSKKKKSTAGNTGSNQLASNMPSATPTRGVGDGGKKNKKNRGKRKKEKEQKENVLMGVSTPANLNSGASSSKTSHTAANNWEQEKRRQDEPQRNGMNTNSSRSNIETPYIEPHHNDIRGAPQRPAIISDRPPHEHEHLPYDGDILQQPLNWLNYKKKFHQLLCREEDEHERILKDKCDGCYNLTIFRSGSVPNRVKERDVENFIRFGCIHGDNLDGDIISYINQSSAENDNVIIHLEHTSVKATTVYGFPPYSFGPNALIVGFTAQELALAGPRWRIREGDIPDVYMTFVLKWSYFNRLHRAINNLSTEVIKRIIPNDPKEFMAESRLDEYPDPLLPRKYFLRLNRKSQQLNALKAILACESGKAPILITGSFGTGKTRLLARAADEILTSNDENRVLICCHHQRSADSFIVNYFGRMGKSNPVKTARLVPNQSYHSPGYYSLYVTVRNLKPQCRLIVTTFSTSLHLLNSYCSNGYFTHILLDEGAQSREPECIAPLCLADRNTKIIVAGDHKQVGPALLVLGDSTVVEKLRISLLERLHTLYNSDELINYSKAHCISLYTNFRCHHALLSLPSYLFYDSMLMTAAESVTHLHPDVKYPLHFICSSLREEVENARSSKYPLEAKLLLDAALKYVSNWPHKQWGDKIKPQNICIMATTPNQKQQLIQDIKSARYSRYLEGVEILTVYDIQGCEFEAIFLSTSEPLESNGTPRNITKSPCSPYVFNTALTRAKSLVVCAGNPFVLMETEKKMDKDSSCWKDYIRRCVTCKTFVVLQKVLDEDALKKEYVHCRIQDIIFSPISFSSVIELTSQKDTILRSLQKAVKHLHKGARLQLKEEQSEMRWDIVDQIHQETTEEESQLDTVQKVECVLSVIDRRCSEAIPIKGASGFDKPIKINGFNFRRGAFDGDIVEVALLTPESSGREAKSTIPSLPSEATKTPSNEPSDDMNNYLYGRVVKVIKPIHQTKHVCTADMYSSINFYPLDKSVPSILNLPKVSKCISSWNLQIHSKEYIAVFKVKADDEVPQIKELVPHSSCEDLLFVVKILGWSPKYRKPLGAVIEVLPRSSHPFYTQRLLKTAYDIDDDGNDDNIDDIPPVVVADDGSTPHYTQAITIDPPEAINLDDALSLVPIPGEKNKYKLAVLISNVAKYITESVSINEVAMNRGTSVYGGATARHMLPSALSSQFSLDFNTSRDVLCVTGTVVMDDGGEVIEVKCNVDESGPEKAKMTSIARLTYKSAQNLLDGIPPQGDDGKTQYDAAHTGMLRDTLKRLLKIANKLLQGRLGEGVVHDLSNDDDEEQVEEWEAHFLVSELMIWANSNIARYLLNNIPDIALLRRQPSPLPEELQSFMTTFQSVLPYSVSLSRHCLSTDTTSNLAIPASLVEKFAKFHGNDKHKLLMHAFMNDSFYPQLATAASAKIKISRPAEYLPAANSDPDTIKHYSLQLIYTHFTSPIRRYFDILVQRLVISLLDGADINYRLDNLKLLCHRLNHRTKMAKRFERDVKKIDTARECEVTLLKTEAFITKSFPHRNYNEYYLCLPDGKFHHIHSNDTKFKADHLGIVKQQEDYATWNVTMAVLDCSHNPLTGLIDATSIDSSTDSKVYCINIEYYKRENDKLKKNSCRTLFNIDTQEVNLDVWRKVHDYVKSPNSHSINDLMEQLPKPQSIAPSASIDNPFTSHPVVRCKIKRPLRECEVVNVWLGKSVKQPLPAPSVCLVEVAPGVCTCVQHVQNGPQCFSDPQLEKCSRDIYNNIEEYVELWSKVLIAEAANDSVSESSRNILLIKNVILEWPRLAIGSCIDDVHHSPVDNGVVQLTVPSDVLNYIKIGIGDMICVRYQMDTPQREAVAAVYHFVVTSKYKEKEGRANEEEEEENVIIKMKAMNNNCLVSEKMKEYLKGPCDMEVIQMPVSFNRVFKRLRHGLNEREGEGGEGGDGRSSRQSTNNDRSKKTWSNLSISIAVDSDKLKSTRAINTSLGIESDQFALKLWDVKKSLNDKQIEAVKLAINNKFQLIQGPPGTGKSVVGAHLVYIFAKLINGGDKSVIYCCPSNKAVDVVHKKLLVLNKSAGASNRLRIIRLYGRKHENMDFPEPKEFNTDNGGAAEGRCLDEYKNDALHYLIREKNPRIEEKRKKLSDMNDKGYLPTPTEKQFYNQLIKDAEKKVLSQKFDVILCTCNETSSGRLLNIRDKISQCIVDECGMASEPETIAAASLCDHVILIGDHKQLQPVIKYTPARECGLSVSLFERYAERPVMEGDKSTLLIRLDVQYRMHASVCRAPSEMFYDGELITDISVTNRRPIINERYWSSRSNGYSSRYEHVKLFDIVHDKPTTGSQYHTGRFNINSHCNETEAIKVLEEVKEMRKLGVASTRIAILTPYAGQKDLMKRKIENDKELKDYKPEVHTIVESQGDEYDIVILTTVRSLPLNQIKHKRLVQPDNRWMRKNLGFLTDEHQLNVGITRARHGLIIIGNVTLLKYNPKWRELIDLIKMKIS